jgi:hypothetical protein
MIDYFESGSVSSFLSWVFGLPLAILLILGMFSFFGKQEGIPWPLSAWVGLCMIIFAPVRYILFILVLADCYVVQSFSALFCAFIVSLYLPLVILVLVLIGLGIPSASLLFYQSMKKHPFLGGALTCIAAPILCVAGTFLFFSLLPLAARTVGWLRVDDVIRATNGPTAIVFRYLVAPYQVLTLPRFYKDTPQKDVDLIRSHVAAVFLNPDNIPYFVSRQYPSLYDAIEEKRMPSK